MPLTQILQTYKLPTGEMIAQVLYPLPTKKTNVELSSNYCSGCFENSIKAVNYHPPDFDDSLYLF